MNTRSLVLVGVLGLALALAAAFLLRDRSPGSNVDTISTTGGAPDGTSKDARLEGRTAPEADAPRPTPEPPAAHPWRLTGRVLDPADHPVAGAEVLAWLDPGGARVLLGRTTSEPDGGYEIPLDPVAETSAALRLTSAVAASASLDGYRPGEAGVVRPLPLDVSGGLALSLDLRLVPGGTVVGTVTDESGELQKDVSVYLRAPASDEVLASAETDEAGAFALACGDASRVEVWAVSRVHGLARTSPLRPDPAGTTDVGALRLARGETIEGRVLFADRTPVGGAWVYANLTNVADDDPHASVSEQVVWKQIGAETDAQGRFTMPVFRPGTYAFALGEVFGHRIDVSAQSGDRNVEIVIPLHCLVVRIRDETGAPLPGCQQWARGWVSEARDDFESAVRGESDPAAGPVGGQYSMAGSFLEDDGTARLLVPPGSAWIFLVALEGLPPLERVVRVPMEGHETLVDLVVGVREQTGALAIQVLDAYGKPIEVFDFELTTSLGSNLARGGSTDPDSLRGVPAGPARLRVLPGPARHHLDRSCQILSPYFPVHAEVDIPPGGTEHVTLRAQEGGWIRLVPELAADAPGGEPPSEDALGGVRVDVRAVGSEGPWTYARMFIYGQGGDLHGTSKLRPNVPTRIGQLFEPGPQELRILGNGFRGVTVPVTVVAGREALVTARIERR